MRDCYGAWRIEPVDHDPEAHKVGEFINYMNRLRRLLPPVSSLVVFEAAGRLNNFTAAAQELNVTQAAVSRQILGLEAHLGLALFHRQHRQVRLTAEGITLHQAVSQGLLAIVEC